MKKNERCLAILEILQKQHKVTVTELSEKFGISEVMRTSFSRMESGFQVYITGTHVPMREMYATMTPGVEYLSLSNLGRCRYISRNKEVCIPKQVL